MLSSCELFEKLKGPCSRLPRWRLGRIWVGSSVKTLNLNFRTHVQNGFWIGSRLSTFRRERRRRGPGLSAPECSARRKTRLASANNDDKSSAWPTKKARYNWRRL